METRGCRLSSWQRAEHSQILVEEARGAVAAQEKGVSLACWSLGLEESSLTLCSCSFSYRHFSLPSGSPAAQHSRQSTV